MNFSCLNPPPPGREIALALFEEIRPRLTQPQYGCPDKDHSITAAVLYGHCQSRTPIVREFFFVCLRHWVSDALIVHQPDPGRPRRFHPDRFYLPPQPMIDID
jgi:hypothetical protein